MDRNGVVVVVVVRWFLWWGKEVALLFEELDIEFLMDLLMELELEMSWFWEYWIKWWWDDEVVGGGLKWENSLDVLWILGTFKDETELGKVLSMDK